tara:strand:- start:1746 stop:1946 length:201 start_codon:yes stop_codon:yes gene_type:complete
MTTFEKVSSFLLILAATIIGCLVVSYLIKYFFIVLGFCFNHPAEAMIATIIIGISLISLPIGKERQ